MTVSLAATFLCLTPLLMAFVEVRRRRSEAAEFASASRPSILPLPAGSGAGFPLESEHPAALNPGGASWEGTVASVPTGPGGDPSAILPPESLVPLAQALETPSVQPHPGHRTPWSPAQPIVRVEVFDRVVPASEGSHTFEMVSLRQARLTDWPPASVRRDVDQSRLWEAGEGLAARFDRALSSASLQSPLQVQSLSFGGVETDGQIFRLYFLLFEDLWPATAGEARLCAVFEIDQANGPVRSWVQRI